MDRLDVSILRLLVQGDASWPLNPNFRTSYAAIANGVGADEGTVRHRLKRMHDSGFLGEWRLLVNPRIWGGGQVAILLEVDSRAPKNEIVEKLRLVPGVMMINSYYERMCITLNFEDETSLPRWIELTRRLSGASSLEVGRMLLPACKEKPSAKDWDLIKALRRNPRKSHLALAAETGLCGRTVRRRLQRIMEEGFAFATPSIDPRGLKGGVLALLTVVCPRDRKKEVDESLQKDLEPCLWHVMHMLPYQTGDPQPTAYDVALRNFSEAREVLNRAEKISGVKTARIDLYERIFTDFRSYDEYLDKKLGEFPTALPG